MSSRKCPIEVLAVAWLYILVGMLGLVRHFPHALVFHWDDIWILLTELLAAIAGVSMLRGHNWARWLAIAWILFHVAISWPVVPQLVVHSVITILIVALLFCQSSRQFFADASQAQGGAD